MEWRPFPQRPLAQAIFQPALRRLLGFPLSLALGACSRKPSRSACVGCRRRRRSARVSPLWMTSTVAQRVPFHPPTREGPKSAKPPSIFLSIFTVSQLYVVSHIVSNFPVIHLFFTLSTYLSIYIFLSIFHLLENMWMTDKWFLLYPMSLFYIHVFINVNISSLQHCVKFSCCKF